MTHGRWWALLVLVPLLACERPAGDLAAAEIAAELRALRTALPRETAPPVDPRMVATALQPLGQAMAELAREQTALGLRQQQLLGELRLCAKLVGDGVADAAAQAAAQQETAALRARLQTVEKELAEQLQRQTEVEAMLRGAVERATRQLEVLLGPPSGKAAPPPASSGAGGSGAAPPAPGGASGPPPVADPPRQAGEGIEKGSFAGDASSPWALVVALCAACSVLWWWRWRSPVAPPDSGAVVGMDRGVEEIWAAAELLGEAVGKLRSTRAPAETAGARPERVDAVPQLGLGIVAEAGGPGAAAAGPPVRTRAAESPRTGIRPDPAPSSAGGGPSIAAEGSPSVPDRRTPPTVQFVVPLAPERSAAGRVALEQLLAADPRVLRRPAPEVVVAAGRAAVRCAVLPGLPSAERNHLEQCLRDAVA